MYNESLKPTTEIIADSDYVRTLIYFAT